MLEILSDKFVYYTPAQQFIFRISHDFVKFYAQYQQFVRDEKRKPIL